VVAASEIERIVCNDLAVVRIMPVYMENDAGLAAEHASAAWVFDLDLWGRCGQGPDEGSALRDLQHSLRGQVELAIAERVHGDERAFARDCVPCTEQERRSTLAVLSHVRPQTISLLRSCSDAELDWDDPDRLLPSFARWRTLRQMGWHIADTESRYYLPCLGLGSRDRAVTLNEELRVSAEHVRQLVLTMPAEMRTEGEHGVWTTVKLLRRLAWHERGELVVMKKMLTNARSALRLR
jgi:hypothetical protein